ncbi:MAG: hypothetical protein SF172_04260 [Burkholderiales bacterium]|nr:hypothetical protein [Burkholderiales bacterium]
MIAMLELSKEERPAMSLAVARRGKIWKDAPDGKALHRWCSGQNIQDAKRRTKAQSPVVADMVVGVPRNSVPNLLDDRCDIWKCFRNENTQTVLVMNLLSGREHINFQDALNQQS